MKVQDLRKIENKTILPKAPVPCCALVVWCVKPI